MKRQTGACLICGKPLVYFEKEKEMECSICHQKFPSNVSCENGHFVCDRCHSEKGAEYTMDYCLKATSTNPFSIINDLMENPFIHMHGPEHHIMVGAALLTAYRNAGGMIELPLALQEMRKRGSRYPGGSCGFWGCCGAAVSCGMFVSIITGATPLATQSWSEANEMTSRALAAIAALGGPRCCKRNSFTAIKVAVEFVHEKYGVQMNLPAEMHCHFSEENKQCKKISCPYYNPDARD